MYICYRFIARFVTKIYDYYSYLIIFECKLDQKVKYLILLRVSANPFEKQVVSWGKRNSMYLYSG